MVKEKRFEIRLHLNEWRKWKKIAECRNISLSQFIRESINLSIRNAGQKRKDNIFFEQISQISELCNEIQSGRKEYKKLFEKISNFDNIQKNSSIEERILNHLEGRQLYLNDLANYCGEKPELILSILIYLQKEKIVIQNSQMRWMKNE